ncbi:MAG: RnfABCDGE type electron transport complex subunit D [Victivallaceae bacterium]|nr:RnfABCDGE type electron transport complex subunit D [Victivallaceae bacterium]
MKKLLKHIKNMKLQLICLLLVLFIVALVKQTPATYPLLLGQLGFAVLTALLAELAFFGAVKSNSIQSAVISGIIIALLLMPGTELKLVWLAVTVAIAVKLLCRFPRGAHIFNPAAAGLLMIMLFWGNRINWWGFSSPYLVIILGGIISYRLKRLSLVFSYLIFRAIGLWLLNGLAIDVDMLLLPNLFFAFIMLIEPKTSPAKRVAQWQFGAGVGLLASLLFTLLPAFDGDLIALLIMNLLRPLLYQKIKSSTQ